MEDITISFMEISDLQKSAKVLSIAMLDAKLHVAVLQGKGENERREIKKFFFAAFLPIYPASSFWQRKSKILSG